MNMLFDLTSDNHTALSPLQLQLMLLPILLKSANRADIGVMNVVSKAGTVMNAFCTMIAVMSAVNMSSKAPMCHFNAR